MDETRGERFGFTLVELLVVIAVLAVLAGAAVPVVSGIQQKSKVNATKQELAVVGKALLAYAHDRAFQAANLKWGRFPAESVGPGGTGVAGTILGLDLDADVDGVGWNPTLRQGWNGPYLQGQAETGDDGSAGAYRAHQLDGWGRPYLYTNRDAGGGFVTSVSGTRVVTLTSGGSDRNVSTGSDNLIYEVYRGKAY